MREATSSSGGTVVATVNESGTASGMEIAPMPPKWSTKEKLFLVSFVLVNGESNWSYVSEQLNKWMLMTSTNEQNTVQDPNANRTSQVSKDIHVYVCAYSVPI
jgi:hypothetical protein